MTWPKIPTGFVEKANFVKIIFTDVEKEYNALLHLMTLGMDWTWRRRMFSKIHSARAVRILDLACGTGLVTFALSKLIEHESIIIGLDPSASMLRPAIRKKQVVEASSLEFVLATGEFMPFRNSIFDYVTVGLALRNFGDKSAVFGEAHRTLIKSGWFLSVDFVLPEKSLLRRLYIFHIFNVLPSLGQLVSHSWHRTLLYLARSIQLSDPPTKTRSMLSRSGFRVTFTEKLTLGIVALIGAQK